MSSQLLKFYTKNWKKAALPAIAIASMMGSKAMAQTLPQFVLNQDKNPFRSFEKNISVNDLQFTFVDLDADGNLDLVTGGNNESKPTFYKNVGSNVAPKYLNIGNDPFQNVNVSNSGGGLRTVFADIDGDGKLDGVSGRMRYNPTSLAFLKNTGSANNPSFIEITGSANPFNSFNIPGYGYLRPSFADVDADGKLDVVVGTYTYNENRNNNALEFLKNVSTSAANPQYERIPFTSPTHPFAAFGNLTGNPTPTFYDVDKDGKIDLIIPNRNYNTQTAYYKNTSSISSLPQYVEITGSANPFDVVKSTNSGYRSLSFIDIDGDGNAEVISNQNRISIAVYKNTSSIASAPVYVKQAENIFSNNLIAGSNANYTRTTFVDIDNDGDDDVLLNQNLNIEGNRLIFLKNTAPIGAAMPAYQVFKGTNAPFTSLDTYSNFTFADIDGDGIKEGIQFENYSPRSFKILKNTTGSASNIQFATVAATSVGLPDFFNSPNSYFFFPIFSDLDNDGISDVSSFYRNLKYFKNTGTASAASFVELNTTDAPFSFSPNSNLGDNVFPAFADLDGDGTDEIIYGNYENEVVIGKNTSSGTNLSFAIIPNSNNPFSIPFTSTSFAFFSPTDIDNDGDIDILAFGGDYNKKQFYLFENKLSNRPTLTNISLNATAGQLLSIPVTAIGANFADIDGQTLQKLRITSLPTKGSLSISGIAAVANQEYIVAGISSIVYLPNTGYQGSDMFGWNGSDGLAYAVSGATTTINIVTVAGLNSISEALSKNEVIIYPVPSSNTLFVKLNNSIGTVTAKVFDLSGQQLLETNTYSLAADFVLEVPVSSLSEGVYLIQILTVDKIVTKKFVKK